jgi:hypothetical protein
VELLSQCAQQPPSAAGGVLTRHGRAPPKRVHHALEPEECELFHRSPAEALDPFESQTAWPMLVLSLPIIPLLVIPLVADLSPATERTLFALDWITCALFAIEYEVRLFLAPAAC